MSVTYGIVLKIYMTKSCYKNEVLNELSEKRTRISLDKSNSNNEDTDGFLECICKTHEKYSKLREGNKIFAVILKKDDNWVVENTTCWQCSVRDVVERITEDVPIAVVEGILERPSIENESEFCITDPRVCDVLGPSK